MDERNFFAPLAGSRTRIIFLLAAVANPICLLLCISAVQLLFAGAGNEAVRVAVFVAESDGGRSFIAGATVVLKGDSVSWQGATNQDGIYELPSVTPGEYQIDVSAPGFTGTKSITVTANAQLDVAVEVKLADTYQSITVKDADDASTTSDPSGEAVIDRPTVISAPNKYDLFDSLLPLVPGVVRGPDGLINMKGTRSSQGGALVNSANVTDPATGNPAMNLPIDVVQSIKVIPDPYDPEYGRLTGAVSDVETTTGNFDSFHLTFQNILPRPRKLDGDFIGIEAFTPRLTVTGPFIKNKIAFTQSFEYRFLRIPVSSLPQLTRDMKIEGFNSYSQADVNLTQKQSLTASFALYPQKYNYLGLNTFTPQQSTPDLHQRGYLASLQHRYATGSDSLLLSQFSFKRFDADVTANSTAPYQLWVETTGGGFFDRQRRNTYRTEWQETYQFQAHHFLGLHQLKAGIDFAHSEYDGRVQSLPVTIFGVSNLPIEQIDFGPTARFDIHQNETAWFLADKWSPVQRLTFDLGVRFDRDSVTNSTNTAPRAGFVLLLTKDEKTLLKGGVGLFYDRVPLNIASFPFLPDRTVLTYDSTGQIVESQPYTNTFTSGLRNPRSIGWNIELDRKLTSALVVRAGFLQRDTVHDFLLTPEIMPGQGSLSLSNGGSSFYREFHTTGVYKFRRDTLNASYVRSKAYGDLNDFNQFFGNDAAPVIEPNGRGPLPFDAPNRFLFWGQFNAPFKLLVNPTFDLHTGFPYSLINECREFVGPRDSERFPRFNSLDLQITRPMPIPFAHDRIKSRIGFSVYNVLNHFNPRDVQDDIDSDRFAALFNGVGRTFRGKFVLEF